MEQSKEARFLHGLKAVVSSGKRDEIAGFTGRKILFFDWWPVYAGYGLRPKQSRDPRQWQDRIPRGVEIRAIAPSFDPEPCFKPEKPWETFYMSAYSTVVRDGNNLRLYYECFLPGSTSAENSWENSFASRNPRTASRGRGRIST
jgi:hypothetical protein